VPLRSAHSVPGLGRRGAITAVDRGLEADSQVVGPLPRFVRRPPAPPERGARDCSLRGEGEVSTCAPARRPERVRVDAASRRSLLAQSRSGCDRRGTGQGTPPIERGVATSRGPGCSGRRRPGRSRLGLRTLAGLLAEALGGLPKAPEGGGRRVRSFGRLGNARLTLERGSSRLTDAPARRRCLGASERRASRPDRRAGHSHPGGQPVDLTQQRPAASLEARRGLGSMARRGSLARAS
jgi:hypothetical protein